MSTQLRKVFGKAIYKIQDNIPLKLDFKLAKLEHILCAKEDKMYRDRRFIDAMGKGLEKIPLFLISFNRLSYLKKMIESMEKIGISNITIIDNHSTYPPLLDYYQSTKYPVIRLDYNGGHRVFWEDERFQSYRNDFYLLSDPDLYMVDECGTDLVYRLFLTLYKYPFVNKVGVSLKIDDIPINGIFGENIRKWETRFYKCEIEKGLYYAHVDTTFALYLPDDLADSHRRLRSFRMAFPYQARHLPWYKSEADISDEDKFYSNLQTNGWWNIGLGEMTKDKY